MRVDLKPNIIIEENLLIFLIYDKWRPVVEWYTRGIVDPFCAYCVSFWCLKLCLHDLKDLEPIRAECLNGSPPMRGLHYAYLVVEYWEEDERSQAGGGQGMHSLGKKIFHENWRENISHLEEQDELQVLGDLLKSRTWTPSSWIPCRHRDKAQGSQRGQFFGIHCDFMT